MPDFDLDSALTPVVLVRYRVERNFFDHWGDAGWVEVDDEALDEPRVQTFATEEEAWAAIREHIADVDQAVRAGFMDAGDTLEDFRVVPVEEEAHG